MNTLIFIGLLGVFAYHCTSNDKEFRGSSDTARLIQGFAGSIGYFVYYATLIWSFWHFAWWQPIVTFVAVIIAGSISAIVFQRTFFGMIISPIMVVLFATLSIIGLL